MVQDATARKHTVFVSPVLVDDLSAAGGRVDVDKVGGRACSRIRVGV